MEMVRIIIYNYTESSFACESHISVYV